MELCVVNSFSTHETNPILYNSYCFHTRVQYPEETFIDFLNDVIQLANYCDFEAKNRMIRDQIIVGMRNSDLRNDLFKLGNPKLDDLLEYLKSVEIHSENVPEASDDESVKEEGYEDIHEKGEIESSENVRLGSCTMESNEDLEMKDQKVMTLNEDSQEDYVDSKVPILEADFRNWNSEADENILQDNPSNSQMAEEKSSSTSNNLHSYIIKKEIIQNDDVSNKTASENSDRSFLDQTSITSRDKSLGSDDSITSNQCVPDGYQNVDENNPIDNKTTGIQRLVAETETKLNVGTRQKTEYRSNLDLPKRKNHKIVEVIELDDSDEDDFNGSGNFNSNLPKITDKSKEILDNQEFVKNNSSSLNIIKDRVPNSFNYNTSNVKNQHDIHSHHSRLLQSETEATAKDKLTFEKHSKNEKRNKEVKNSYICDMCFKNFSSKYILRNHILRHLGNDPYKCDNCSKTFSHLQNLKTHMLIHTGEKPYKCDECDKSFRQLSNLNSHAERHARKKMLTCKICNKVLSSRYSLKRHEFTHTGARPHCCNFCNKTFSQANSLVRHEFIHTGEKPHTCNICNKSFFLASNLMRHELIHTAERPYSCNKCNKSYTRSSHLKRHKFNHH